MVMELNRNQFFLIGVLLLFVGAQLRWVESYVLNDKATQFLHQRMQGANAPPSTPLQTAMISSAPVSRRTITPPRWLGWSLMSIGSVLILHSLAMKKPGP